MWSQPGLPVRIANYELLMRDRLPQVVLSMSHAEIPALVDALVAQGVRILALRPVNRLEAYFLSLTHA